MKVEQSMTLVYSVNLQIDGNEICFAQNLERTDAEQIATDLKKTVVGAVEIVSAEMSLDCEPSP